MNRPLLLAAAGTMIALWSGLCQAAEGKAVPRPKEPVAGPKPDVAKEQHARGPSERDRLLVKYLANIEEIVRERRRGTIAHYKRRFDRYRKVDEDLKQRAGEVLQQLLAESQATPAKRLTLEGECHARRALVPTSAASARIFTQLYRKNAVDVLPVISALSSGAPLIAKEWTIFLHEILANAEKDSRLWRRTIQALYEAGEHKYRPILRRMAVNDSNVRALELLLFEKDPETKELRRIVSHDNLALMRKLSGKEFPPGIRVACAHYAAEIRDLDLAQRVCSDLLRFRYKEATTRAARRKLRENRLIFHAKHAAITLMFFGLRNEGGFNLVYERSRMRQPSHLRMLSPKQLLRDKKLVAAWRRARKEFLSACSDSEVSHARSLIREVTLFGGQKDDKK